MGLCDGNLFFTNTKLLEVDMLLQYDGTVSVDHPLSTATFDPANCRSSLYTHYSHPKLSALSNNYGISSNLAHLSQIISSMMSMTHAPLKPPMTSTQPCTSISAPAILLSTQNTLSKLSQFLEYTKITLNVDNACMYEKSL
jgi:hypothetical protein